MTVNEAPIPKPRRVRLQVPRMHGSIYSTTQTTRAAAATEDSGGDDSIDLRAEPSDATATASKTAFKRV